VCVFHYPYWLNRCDRNTYLQTQSKVINKGQQRRVSNSGFRHEPVKSSSLHQHTQPKLNSRLETTPEIASHNVNDSTEKEAGDLGKECEEEEGDERKESENEEKKRDEEDEDNKVEPYEQHITTDTKQGLGCKRVRKYPVTRGKDFLWEI